MKFVSKIFNSISCVLTNLLQPRKWPDLTLKSPGTKPTTKRQSNSNSNSSFSNTLPFGSKASSQQAFLASECDQQSPTTTNSQLSSSDFSVFANVNIPISSSSMASSSFFNTSHAFMQDDTISIVSTSTIAPHQRRYSTASNPPSHINSSINHISDKPLKSPRMHPSTSSVSPGRPMIEDDQASPNSYRPNPYQRSGIRNQSITAEQSSPGYHHHQPPSPRYTAELSNENGHHHHQQQPISPHVNVPPNANNLNHNPPPLPPRRPPKKNQYDIVLSQLRQDPDAPTLMPRDKDPPPLPPRTHHLHQLNNFNNTWNHLVSSLIVLKSM